MQSWRLFRQLHELGFPNTTDEVVFFRSFWPIILTPVKTIPGSSKLQKVSSPMRWKQLCEHFQLDIHFFQVEVHIKLFRVIKGRWCSRERRWRLSCNWKAKLGLINFFSVIRVKDSNDEAKAWFLLRAVIGTAWDLRAIQWKPSKLSYERLIKHCIDPWECLTASCWRTVVRVPTKRMVSVSLYWSPAAK